ncbi:MAG: tRNA pseudouridine(55) synthase TruB [Clostridiales bacterium]|jgi:tRNA pseudouridine55 synthase|nr:tRNA pseudouridine(55) synthase TruB [Eubacteriales bacterium]MDH7564912.1 tRNA pseudouridine(55) synthase TruB [Clostridiales bacterium]
MDGILNVLKPPGMTSFDVVGYLRKVLKIRKIGHTGTLDPEVAGVLPICIGKATKAMEFMVEKDKVYRAELTLGTVTDTQDSTGKAIQTFAVTASEESIREAVNSFTGKYRQVPPMYSAVKVNGKKLYELARSGITIEREPREVEIYSINILYVGRDPDKDIGGKNRVLFDVHCSKGTYVRTLCADIGEKLGCGGHMSFLLRLKSGIFDISDAITLDEIRSLAENGLLNEKLINAEAVFENLRRIELDQQSERKFLNGQYVKCPKNCTAGETVRVYDSRGTFLALGEIKQVEDHMRLKSKKLFI